MNIRNELPKISWMVIMKNRLLLLSLLLAGFAIVIAVIIAMSVTATAAPDTYSDRLINITATPTQSGARTPETPVRVTPYTTPEYPE